MSESAPDAAAGKIHSQPEREREMSRYSPSHLCGLQVVVVVVVQHGTPWYSMVHFGTAWYTLVQHSMVHFSGTICDFLFWCTLVVLGTLCEEILAFSLVRPTAWYTLVQYSMVHFGGTICGFLFYVYLKSAGCW